MESSQGYYARNCVGVAKGEVVAVFMTNILSITRERGLYTVEIKNLMQEKTTLKELWLQDSSCCKGLAMGVRRYLNWLKSYKFQQLELAKV